MTALRVVVELTKNEREQFKEIIPVQGKAWEFWKQIARDRKLDHRSLLTGKHGEVTGLPLGHGQAWCYPSLLKCRKPPPPMVERTYG